MGEWSGGPQTQLPIALCPKEGESSVRYCRQQCSPIATAALDLVERIQDSLGRE